MFFSLKLTFIKKRLKEKRSKVNADVTQELSIKFNNYSG